MRVPIGSGLRPIEVASGLVFGVERNDSSAGPAGVDALTALEAAIRPALRRPPCLVSFSGGRDSSCVLALATRLAREEGLLAPVPVTLRFPDLPESDETVWQERVVDHLGIREWIRLEPGNDLDVVGPVATSVLRRHGLLWPFNAYVHAPMLERAQSGSLLTGVGGDELFGQMAPSRWHGVVSGRVRPRPRDLLSLGLAAAPRPIRRAVLRRRCPLRLPWLTDEGSRALAREWAAEGAAEPRLLARRAAWWGRRRALRVAVTSLETLAADEDVRLVNPLASPLLAAAILRDRQLARGDRAHRLAAIFGDLLPSEIYGRRSKASFNRAFFGPSARKLTTVWTGEGVDDALVDPGVLRAAWNGDAPDGRTFLLLQSAWLSRATRAAASS